MENKREIFNSLVETLKLTKIFNEGNLEISYDENSDVVIIRCGDFEKRQSVWGDGGVELISDVVGAIKTMIY